MRKVILESIMSLEGYIEGANGEIDWIPFDQEAAAYLNSFADEIDIVFYGRVSYDMYGSYSPQSDIDDEKSFYSKINSKKKYVFSKQLDRVEGGATLINSDMIEEVERIKNEAGRNIWLFGGANLITSFVNADLIDEYRISMAPLILGSGKPLFQQISNRVPLKLLRQSTSASGVISMHYERRVVNSE